MISIEMLEGWLEEDKALIKLLETLIEQSNAHETALIAQDMVWEDIRRQTEALSKLTERVEAIEAKAQGKGFFPPGIVERLDDIETRLTNKEAYPLNEIVSNSKSIAEIESDMIDIESRLEALEDAVTNRDHPEPNEPLTSQLPIDLSNYCGKYKPEPSTGHWVCERCGKDWGDGSYQRRTGMSEDYCPGSMGGCRTWNVKLVPPEPKEYPQAAENQSGTQELKPSEECDYCGALYNTIYRLPDDIWDRIKHDDKRGVFELICPKCADKLARRNGIYLYWEGTEGNWASPIEDELRRKLADMQIEYDRSEREREGAVDEIDTLKETNRQLKAEVERLGAMPSCDPTACWHVHAREELAKENAALRADLAAAQAKVDNALALARANLTYYEEDPECAPIRVTCVPVDLRRIIAALDK